MLYIYIYIYIYIYMLVNTCIDTFTPTCKCICIYATVTRIFMYLNKSHWHEYLLFVHPKTEIVVVDSLINKETIFFMFGINSFKFMPFLKDAST